MKIPFAKPLIGKKEISLVNKVLKSGILTHGPYSKKFENEFSNFSGVKNVIAISSCTSALLTAYYLSGLDKNSEFIVPAQTHVATVHAGTFLGAKPVFVDCEEDTGNINVDLIEKKITKKTKAITVVHFLGKPVKINKILQLCRKYNLKLIEDCALALGAKYNNKHVGSLADFACFSFYPAKHIATGDGGILICKNKGDLYKAKLFKGFGVDKTFDQRKIPGEYDVLSIGLNFRMTEMQCALGFEQLKRLKFFIKKRTENFEMLSEKLNKIKNVKIIKTKSENNYLSSYYCLSILLTGPLKKKRRKIIQYLNKKGIGTSIYYPKILTELKYYKKKLKINKKNFFNANNISENSICLPIGPHVSKKNIYFMKKTIKEINKI
jgi:perosamine synthetase